MEEVHRCKQLLQIRTSTWCICADSQTEFESFPCSCPSPWAWGRTWESPPRRRRCPLPEWLQTQTWFQGHCISMKKQARFRSKHVVKRLKLMGLNVKRMPNRNGYNYLFCYTFLQKIPKWRFWGIFQYRNLQKMI